MNDGLVLKGLVLIIMVLCAGSSKSAINPSFFAGESANGKVATIDELEFILPESGCPMAHCDPQNSDLCHLPVPKGNVEIVWHRCELAGERGSSGLGFSGNGNIAACTFCGYSDNLVVYDYDGNHIWSSGKLLNVFAGVSAPMVDVYDRVIACDNRVVIMVDPYDYDADGKILEWKSELPKGGIPISPVIIEDGIIFLATKGGPIYAYDSRDGALLAWRYLKSDEQINPLFRWLDFNDRGYFETINAPCVKGNRVYISTHYKGDMFSFRHHARLYAIDVDPYNPNTDERLKIAWYYEFVGPSCGSPLLINNTIYFDGDPIFWKNPQIFAVTDMGNYGKEEWKKTFTAKIEALFARDLRGGFWIIDYPGSRLIRLATEDGSVIEEIDIDTLVQEPGRHRPSSVITMCGNETNPVLIISATAIIRFFMFSSYVIAVDLADNNSLLWKVKISDGSLFSLDFPFGQYPILMKNGEPRIVFSSIRGGGAWAIGVNNPLP